MSDRKRRIWVAALLMGLIIVPLVAGIRQHPSSFDDAYITYRYARNLALGRGFVYNIGESVLGTTTPLYTLLLAGLSLIWPDLPLLSHSISVAAWMLSVPVIYGIGRMGRSETVGIMAAALVALNALFLNVLGMETTLYVLLALSTFYFHLKDKPTWAAVCAGMTFLVRWDGILVVGVFLGAELLKRKERFLRASLVSAGIIVPWPIYSYLTFGSIFPNSFYAKAGQGWNQSLGGVEIGSFVDGLLAVARSAYAENHLFALLPLLAGLGTFSILQRGVQWWPVLLWTAAYLGGYVVLGMPRFDWYYTPLAPAFALLVAEGIEWSAGFLSWRLGLRSKQIAATAALSVLGLLPNADWLVKSQQFEMGAHSATYVEVGEWLQNHTPPDSSVAMIEIGIIGFYGDRTVVDTMGLVSPEMIGHLEGWLQTLQFAINYYWPDYVVALERTAWQGIVNEPWFTEAYTLETQIENSADPVAPATIYRRRAGFPIRNFALNSPREVWLDDVLILRQFQVAESHLEPGSRLHVRLSWEASANISRDYRWQFDLLNASDGQQWPLAIDLQPMRGGNPTYQWLQGDKVVDAHTLTVPAEVPEGSYLLRLIARQKDGPVAVSHAAGAAVGHIAVGPIHLGEGPTDLAAPAYPVTATFADNIRLTGYDLAAGPDNSLSVTLYWQADGAISQDYTAFVHLMSPEGGLVAQHDSPPPLPTTLWLPQIQVADAHTLMLPAALPADVYPIRVGLYHWPDLERVAAVAPDCLDAANDALLVGYVSYGAAPMLEQEECTRVHWIQMGGE